MAEHSFFSRFRLFPSHWNDRSLVYPAILLVSLAGLAIVGMSVKRGMQAEKKEIQEELELEGWEENLIPAESYLIDLLLRDVSDERSLAIFKNGTIVVIQEPTEDPKGDALKTLDDLVSKTIAFAVNRVSDDYVVRYEGPAFTRISGDSVAEERFRIQKHWEEFLLESEQDEFGKRLQDNEFEAKVGLIARSFLMKDGEEREMIKILKARSK